MTEFVHSNNIRYQTPDLNHIKTWNSYLEETQSPLCKNSYFSNLNLNNLIREPRCPQSSKQAHQLYRYHVKPWFLTFSWHTSPVLSESAMRTNFFQTIWDNFIKPIKRRMYSAKRLKLRFKTKHSQLWNRSRRRKKQLYQALTHETSAPRSAKKLKLQ